MQQKRTKGQSSFELLLTLSFGLAILLPVVVIAFIQVSNANTSLSSAESQQAASNLASVASVVGSEGVPAKVVTSINVPPGVSNIYVGNTTNGVGNLVIFVVESAAGPSYITEYVPVAVSGNLQGVTTPGTYLINISAQSSCPSNTAVSCVYMKAIT
jgi:hypothetical protein